MTLALAVLALAPADALALDGVNFTFSPATPVVGQKVTFTDVTPAKVVTRQWDFNSDGTIDATSSPGSATITHTFTTPGKHPVTLIASTANDSGKVTKIVTVAALAVPSQPPTARMSVSAGGAGESSLLNGSSSRDPDGGQIVAYEWDLDGDGDFDANTGDDPQAEWLFNSTGPHRVGMRVTDDEGDSSLTSALINIGNGDPACTPRLRLGPLDITGCIQRDGDRYTIEGRSDLVNRTPLVLVNGLALKGTGELVLDVSERTLTANGEIALELINTPIGNIELYRARGQAFRWQLPALGARGAQSGGRFRVVTFQAGSNCPTGERSVCAKLPGNFPLRGGVDVYVNSSLEAEVEAHAELDRPFTVRGDVRLRISETGLDVDELGFRMDGANLGVFRLERLGFSYRAPGVGDPPSTGSTWEVDAAIFLPTPQRAGVEGLVRFEDGQFAFASATLHAGRLAVGPGIFLNSFGGEFGLRPHTRIGGNLSLGFGPADIAAAFRYEGTDPSLLHVDGNLSLAGQRLANAFIDYRSNGDLDFGGGFRFSSPPFEIDGRIDGWYQQPNYNLEGFIAGRILVLSGRVEGLVSSTGIAGCLETTIEFLGTHRVRVGAGYRWNTPITDISLMGASCDVGPWRGVRLRGAGAAQAGHTINLPSGLPTAAFEVAGSGRPPVVTLTAPNGERFTTPTNSSAVGRSGRFLAMQSPTQRKTYVLAWRPPGGAWKIEAAPGSAPITGVRSANGLPAPAVRASVRGKGARRTLRYRIKPISGQRVTFLEDGSDTTHVIGTTRKARGSFAFTPRDGRGRRRRIVGVVTQNGLTRDRLTLGSYRAPRAIRPGRPGRVRIRRRGTTAIVSWKRAARAGGYRVQIKASDGRRSLHFTRRRRLRVRGVLPFERVTARVTGEYGATHRAGPARRATLKPVKRRRGR